MKESLGHLKHGVLNFYIFTINTASLMKGVAIFMKIKFRNVDTGEIIEIDEDDFEAFDECMSHKNYQLIFD